MADNPRLYSHNDSRTQWKRVDPATGLYMMHGNGCRAWANCFTCPLEKCYYGSQASENHLNNIREQARLRCSTG